MSKYHGAKITCPVCSKPYDICIWDSVNAQLNPEKKEELLSNTFYQTICPFCEAETDCIYGFLYHDMNKKYMISIGQDYPNKALKEMIKSGYSFRKVEDLNQLVEKIRIFDSGLNDIVIEIVKKIISEIKKIDNEFLFGEVQNDELVFLILKEEKAISVPRSIYNMVFNDCTYEDLKEIPKFRTINKYYIESQIIK